MRPSDTYHSIEGPSVGLYREKGSKFLAYAYPLPHEEALKPYLEDLRKQHPKARHFCYAWRLGLDGQQYRANDDGEPAGSAGRPILGQIDSQGLTHVLVVVVRYFGGTKLGVPGLIHAYKSSTADALAQATIVERHVYDHYYLHFDYAIMSALMGALKRCPFVLGAQDFAQRPRIEVAVRAGGREAAILRLKALVAGVSEEQAAEMEALPGLEIEYRFTA